MSLKTARARRFRLFMYRTRDRVLADLHVALRGEVRAIERLLAEILDDRVRRVVRLGWGWKLMIVRDPDDQLRSRKIVDLGEMELRQTAELFVVNDVPLGRLEPTDLAGDEGGAR
jgi:hypothetical protein